MKKQEFNYKYIKVSIGAKFVTVITVLILISFGAVIFLVSKFVRQDFETSVQVNNVELNRRVSAEVEQTFEKVIAGSHILIQIINAAGADSALAKQAADFFFEQNNNIAALVFYASAGEKSILINSSFFFSWDVDASLADSYFDEEHTASGAAFLRAAAGEPVFLNAASFFSTHLLALFFPLKEDEVFSVLYYPGNLSDSFNSQVNRSFIVNNEGDILIQNDNITVDKDYISRICENPMFSGQDVYEKEGVKYFAAYKKLISGACIAVTAVEYGKILEGINKAVRFSLLITAVLLFLSVLIVSNLSKSISVSLKALANAAHKIEGGNFEINLASKSRDEIGYLTQSFLRMSKSLGIYRQFTNREVALKKIRGEINTDNMEKNATLFFLGIRGFTKKLENFTDVFGRDAPDKIVSWLNDYFTQISACIEKTNGMVDKFIGDTVMAHWGAASTAGTPAKDAFNCVKAALMTRKALVLMNRNRRPDNPLDSPIHAGCGIDTGIVTAGQTGTNLHKEYTVLGSHVKLASEIESMNKKLGTDILITENTWNLVRYFFKTEEMPPLTGKGNEKPVRIFAVINHVSVTTGPKTLADVRQLLGITL